MQRLVIAFFMALVICYGLIGLMAWMVDLNTKAIKEHNQSLQLDIFMAENEQDSQRIKRALPEPPRPKPQPPATQQPQTSMPMAMVTPALESLPEIKMDLAVTGMQIAVPTSNVPNPTQSTTKLVTNVGKVGLTQQVMPLQRVEPNYPRKALQRSIEGYVVLSFDIDKRGKPKNIEVVDAKPARIFTREAKKALKNWSYQPQLVNGIAQDILGQKIKLEFKLR